MTRLLHNSLLSFALLAAFSLGLLAQTTTTDQGTQSDTGVKQDLKKAGHATKSAAKKTARKTKHVVKKGVHKGAHKTRQGAGKVESSTQPQ